MNWNFTLIKNFILIPFLIIFFVLLLYRLLKKGFRNIRLGAVFFFLCLSLLGYFYANQFYIYGFFKIIWAQKIFIFIALLSGSAVILKILDELIFNKYLLKKADVRVPNLFRDILIFTLLLAIILIIIRIEFGIKITGILTSSAIISVIIGLALQDTLSNIIAGIVLHIENPFGLGDWIKVGELEGEAVEISWRATRLKTIDGNLIVIPNTNISKDIILNYYKPEKAHAITLHIGIEYPAPPQKVKELILKTIQDCRDILKNPEPSVYITDFGDSAVRYEIKIWINDHSLYKRIKDEILAKIWYSLKREHIQIPFPIRTVHIETKKEPDYTEIKKKNVGGTELFRNLKENDILEIAASSKIKNFTNGERIIIEGEESCSLYIIIKGEVGIQSGTVYIRDLKEGEYFGEMSLLTGEKRSATVTAKGEVTLLEIGPSDIMPVIKKHPNLTETLSKILAERKLLTKDIVEKAVLAEKTAEKENLSRNILNRIRNFFSLNL